MGQRVTQRDEREVVSLRGVVLGWVMGLWVPWSAVTSLFSCAGSSPLVVVGEDDDPAWRVEERHGAPGGNLDVDPRRRWEVVGVVGPRAVELAVADDDTASIEDEALVLGYCLATPPWRPGDALREEATRAGCNASGEQVARPFGADPVVA